MGIEILLLSRSYEVILATLYTALVPSSSGLGPPQAISNVGYWGDGRKAEEQANERQIKEDANSII